MIKKPSKQDHKATLLGLLITIGVILGANFLPYGQYLYPCYVGFTAGDLARNILKKYERKPIFPKSLKLPKPRP